jgi:adenosylcobinamide-GDP ribazoletransferase
VDAAAAAVGFLTVLPVPEERATRGHAHATAVFPWVGLALGALALLVRAAPLDPIVAAALAVAALAFATGGLHWDGWADVLDAMGTPGLPRSRRVEILEDPRIGAHAALGVALLVLVRVVALARTPAWAVLMGAVLGRSVMVVTLRWAPTLRKDGAGARLAGRARPFVAALAPIALAAATAVWGGSGRELAVAIGVGGVVAAVAAAFVVRRLGGMNGDGHGAVGLLAESAVWAAAIP